MNRYSQINSDMWTDPDFEELTRDEKLFYCYLLTSPYSNLAGYYRVSPKRMSEDVGMEKEKILPMLLDQKKLWKYDQETSQVLIPNYLKYNKIYNAKQFRAINTQIMTLEKCPLLVSFIHALNKYAGEEAIGYLSKDILVYAREMSKDQDSPITITVYRLTNDYISSLNNNNT